MQPQTRKIGSLDEWLSQRSAKPCTAVRIRQEPLIIENYFSRLYFGSLDEWLSQWSAKPCTAVRIRQEPQRKASKLFVMNASRLFLFCPSVTLAGLSGGSLFSWLPLAGSLGGFVVFLLRYSSSNGCCMIVHHPLHDHATDGGQSCNSH